MFVSQLPISAAPPVRSSSSLGYGKSGEEMPISESLGRRLAARRSKNFTASFLDRDRATAE